MSATTSGRVDVPDIGDFDGVPVIEILVAVGDTVSAEDPLITLESDKATMDVPAPFGGVVTKIGVSVGDSVAQGTELMVITPAGESQGAVAEPAAEEPEAITDPPQTAQTAPPTPGETVDDAAPGTPEAGGGPIYASPSVRRLARELGVDLHGVDGSARKGRITPQDVREIADTPPGARATGRPRAAAPTDGGRAAGAPSGAGLELLPWPSVDFERYGPVERVPRSRIAKIAGANLARNWVMIPHVTQNDEADITELEAWRKELNEQHRAAGVKFTMVSFLVKACVAALREFPMFNASLDGDELVLKRYYNLGFAADTPGGLVVPVIRDADTKGVREIATDLSELSARAREGKLGPADMSGATFTISSLGGIGGTSFTPIINAPEVAILGVTRSVIKPVWDGTSFVPRLMVPLSLSYDHRVIDGAAAARFTVFLTQVLSDLRRVLL